MPRAEEATSPGGSRALCSGIVPASPRREEVATSELVVEKFAPSVRDAGRTCYEQGRVRVTEVDDLELVAGVEAGGSEKALSDPLGGAHEVALSRSGATRIQALCDCERALDGESCAHVWAVLLACLDDARAYRWLQQSLAPESLTGLCDSAPGPPSPSRPRATTPSLRTQAFGVSTWRKRMGTILDRAEQERALSGFASPQSPSETRPVLVAFSLAPTSDRGWPASLEIRSQKQRVDGTWGPTRRSPLKRSELALLEPAGADAVLDRLAGAGGEGRGEIPSRFLLSPELLVEVGPSLAASRRLFLRTGEESGADPSDSTELNPLEWDGGDPWEAWLEMVPRAAEFRVDLQLRRGEERIALTGTSPIFPGHFAVVGNSLCRVMGPNLQVWHSAFAEPLAVPAKDADDFLEQFHSLPLAPQLHAPPSLEWLRIAGRPIPCLILAPPGSLPDALGTRIEFDYSGVRIGTDQTGERLRLREEKKLVVRGLEFERTALEQAREHGIVSSALPGARLHEVVTQLETLGWRIEGHDGPLLRAPRVHAEVVSGVDWFDLDVRIEYGNGETLTLPELIRAMKRNAKVVRLSGGGIGFLPEEWLERHGWLLEAGKIERGVIRFRRSQVALLDALLAAEPATSTDEVFSRMRTNLRAFEGIGSVPAPSGFGASLRPYQEISLGWFAFLREMGFGGCLADDMGLGKTVMVLALLDSRRQQDFGTLPDPARGEEPHHRPSLIVLPRSLVFNWKREAERFAPRLRIHDHTSSGRGDLRDFVGIVDVVLTTYGVLRRDIVELREIPFDYVILDESQAIKNPSTAAAKSVRLLCARHRLALSGTPVENHLGELWSLFEFLNPGLLGSSPAFGRWVDATGPAPAARDALARAVQPFVLRRSKEQVLTELPPKEEQTLFCTLGDRQRKLYDDLRRHYQSQLRTRDGGESVQVLEALLRLRQAACHPGLVDPRLMGDDSAKLDVLLERLVELVEEGHKALVFSQFTTLLGIVKERLQIARIPYEYLDGRVRNREERVAHFQEDPRVPVFLISLKAGGTGLNLTAASYVFLLDPWWNPATEAQAIDRAHRMGQQRPVLACRLVAQDTVEERILELQDRKRGLADAVIRSDDTALRGITREDLELLLS